MKKIFILIFTLTSMQLFSQTYYINSITVLPSNPNSSSNIQMLVSGNLSNSCAFISNASFSLIGNQISLVIDADEPAGCLGTGALIPKDTLIEIGVLAQGNYTVSLNGDSIDSLSFTVSNISTTIKNIDNKYLRLLSNPVVNFIQIENSSSYKYKYVLIDLNGNLIEEDILDKKIDVSYLPNGIYYLKLEYKEEAVVFKIVK